VSKNLRKHIRTKLQADVKVSHPNIGEARFRTGDISDGGAYIFADDKALPELGEVVSVQVQGMGAGEAPIVKMKVVRRDKDGVGLEFIDEGD